MTAAIDVITDNSIMPFGEHKGKKMANVPANYLYWLYKVGCYHAGVARYIQDNIEVIKSECDKK